MNENLMKLLLDRMQKDIDEIKSDTKDDLQEIKADVKKLMIKEAHRTGAMVGINAVIAVIVNFLATWLGSKH